MFHRETGLDLWVTEYACQNFNNGPQCDEGMVWNLHKTVSAWFDQTDYVKRYSPFGVMKNMQDVNQMNALMDPNGAITSLGSWVSISSPLRWYVRRCTDTSTSTVLENPARVTDNQCRDV